MIDRFRDDLGLTHFTGIGKSTFEIDESVNQSLERRVWSGRVASAGVRRGSGAFDAMEGKSHVKISQPEYRFPHLVVKSPKRENKVGRGRKALRTTEREQAQ